MREGKSNKYFHHYAPIYFSVVLNEALSTFRNYEKLNFIDVGCGKGNGILIASNFNFKKIILFTIQTKLKNLCLIKYYLKIFQYLIYANPPIKNIFFKKKF